MAFGIKLVQSGVTLAPGTAVHPAPITVSVGVLCYLSFTGTTTTYAWALPTRPTGSGTVMSSATSAGPTILTDIDNGAYSVTFVDDAANTYVLDIVTPTTGGGGGGGGSGANGFVSYATTIAGLRVAGASADAAITIDVKCYAVIGDGGGGSFDYDSTDTASPDNGGTIIVCGTRRYKRRYDGVPTPPMFGADSTGVVDAAAAFTAAANAARHVLVPPGSYNLPSGWSVPRTGITIELARGAVLLAGDTIVTDKSQVNWLGHAFGLNFNSDGLSTWFPNIQWTSSATNKPAMQWAVAASVDGCTLDGILVDGAVAGVPTAQWGYRLGTGGFGCSGIQFGAFGTLDCTNGLHLRAAVEESGFHCPYLNFRFNASSFNGTLGVGVGNDADYDGGITSVVVGDFGGTISGFTKGVQVGGTAGRCTTVAIGGDGFIVIETFRSSGAVAVDLYDAYVARVRGLHVELHGMLVSGVTTAADGVIQTFFPHGLSNGQEVSILGVGGTTNVNGIQTVSSVVDTTHFKIGVSTIGQTYTSGGIASVTAPSTANRCIVVGHTGTVAIGIDLAGNYLAGTQYPIETIGFDQLHIGHNDYELSGGGSPTNPSYIVKNTGGGLRQIEGHFEIPRGQRGQYYGGDISDTTGFLAYDAVDRDSSNSAVARRYFDGTYEGPYLRSAITTGELNLGKQYVISGATGNGVNPTVFQTSVAHKIRTGDSVYIKDVGGNTASNATAQTATYVDSTHFSVPVNGNGAFSSNGTATVAGGLRQQYGGFDATLTDFSNPIFRVDDGIALILANKAVATAGATTQVPTGLQVSGSVWNGAAAVAKFWAFTPVIVTANPFYAYWDMQIGGSSKFAVDSFGTLWPKGYGAFREVWSTGAAPNSAAPDGGDWNVGDAWVRTDVTSGNPSRWRCTTAGHTGTVAWKVECTLA